MKPTERDDLLIRLDERSRNTWVMVEKLEKHQVEQNGLIRDSFDQIANNSKQTTKNATWIIAFRWIVGGVGTALAIVLTRLWGVW